MMLTATQTTTDTTTEFPRIVSMWYDFSWWPLLVLVFFFIFYAIIKKVYDKYMEESDYPDSPGVNMLLVMLSLISAFMFPIIVYFSVILSVFLILGNFVRKLLDPLLDKVWAFVTRIARRFKK